MVEVSKKILMHGLACYFSIIIFLVELKLRFIDLVNGLFELFESEVSIAASTC